MNIDELLTKKGVKYEELGDDERDTLKRWLGDLERNQLTIPLIQEYIVKMRDSVALSLSDTNDTPTGWLSVLSFFIPLIGVIRHWYNDQKRLALIARFKNYTLLEAMLSSPEKARKAIEKSIGNIGTVSRQA